MKQYITRPYNPFSFTNHLYILSVGKEGWIDFLVVGPCSGFLPRCLEYMIVLSTKLYLPAVLVCLCLYSSSNGRMYSPQYFGRIIEFTNSMIRMVMQNQVEVQPLKEERSLARGVIRIVMQNQVEHNHWNKNEVLLEVKVS